MPQLGGRHPGFVSESMRCWALVYDGTLQVPEQENLGPIARIGE